MYWETNRGAVAYSYRILVFEPVSCELQSSSGTPYAYGRDTDMVCAYGSDYGQYATVSQRRPIRNRDRLNIPLNPSYVEVPYCVMY